MFYAQFVLAKKGPLARIWLAAHWDKKLTKAHVFETNIEKSVDGILQPKVKMALRTSGHLLLGVVRIYSRKAKYLLADCNEAFVKIKMAFRPGMVDLPEDNREAAVNAITLPEVFHDFDTTMPELNDVDIEAQFSLNQSRAEEITMREDYGHAPALDQEDGFDLNFDEDASELIRNHAYDQDANMLFEDGPLGRVCDPPQFASSTASMINQMEIDGDAFSGNLNADAPQLFALKLFDDTPMGGVDINEPPAPPSVPPPAPESDDDDHFGDPTSPMGHPSSDDGLRPGTPVEEPQRDEGGGVDGGGGIDLLLDNAGPSPSAPPPSTPDIPGQQDVQGALEDGLTHEPPLDEEHAKEAEADPVEHTHLVHNEEESFALAPIDASVVKGFTKTKRKRKLIVDEVKNISGEEMKAQLSDTSDIVITLDLAPPTKRLMHWKESGGVEKLFALPGRPIPARVLFKKYQRHLTSRSTHTEDHRLDEHQDQQQQQVEQEQQHPEPQAAEPVANTRRARKRKPMEPIEENFQQEILEPAEPPRPLSVPPVAAPEEDFLKQPPPASPYRTAPPTPLHEIQQHLNQLPVEEPHLPDQTPSFSTSGVQGGFTPQTSMFMENMGYVQQDQIEPQLQDITPQPQSHQLATEEELNVPEPPAPDPSLLMANMGYDESHPPATTPGALSEKGAPTPYHEDYEMPVSVGPAEEQATDETYEQFEERVLNKRAAIMYRLVKSRMERSPSGDLYLSELTARNNNKKAVAQKFYSLLVLKKFKVLNLSQDCSYGEIHVTRGPNFENPTL